MTPSKEPVIYANIVTAIMAVLGALVALNVISLLPEQMQAIEAAIGAVLLIAGPVVATVLARRNSTPLADPKDVDGLPLVRESGEPSLKVQERAMAEASRGQW